MTAEYTLQVLKDLEAAKATGASPELTELAAIELLELHTEVQNRYPLADELYAGSKDWAVGTYNQRVQWLHIMYEGAKDEIERLTTEVQALQTQLEAVGAGGVSQLAPTTAPAPAPQMAIGEDPVLSIIKLADEVADHARLDDTAAETESRNRLLEMVKALVAKTEASGIDPTKVPHQHKIVPTKPTMWQMQSALNEARKWSAADAPLPRGQELWAAEKVYEAMLQAAPAVPELSPETERFQIEFANLPLRKLKDLLAHGYRVAGVCIESKTDGQTRFGAATTGGRVLWWRHEQQQPTTV